MTPFMDGDQEFAQIRLEALRARFNARAAGWWRVSVDSRELNLVAFSAAADMPVEVGSGFAEATRSVSLQAVELGIVKAVISREVSVSRLSEISPESGSGLWLRRFEAVRSVAVPIRDDRGNTRDVVSLALAELSPDDESVSRIILETASSWPEFADPGLGGSLPRQ